ncbi:MAG: YidC/Oxa1 family membrane protein insertase [Candidatus Atribacteria bacterium]|nr:YidC/Oxa1 family membrane protein insertase [Candidatus Atribacteria bacterium]
MGEIWNSLIGMVEQVLVVLYGFTHNYGIAIILLTIIIRILMYPLMQKQMVSMRETQKIQPLMQEIQRKYKNDKERMNQELMRLYREHKVNPMGGCLPLIIQMPILIIFFQVLREFKYLNKAGEIVGGFLWIPDKIESVIDGSVKLIAGLAAPDQLFGQIGGYSIGILPILVGVSMYFQQKLTTPAMPKSSQGNDSSNPAASTQKMMTTIMPLMIGFISFSLPSGLNLYWLISTLLGIGQQVLINKKEPKVETKKDVEAIPEITTKIEKKESKKEIKSQKKEEEVSWIPGYERPVPQQTKDSNKDE